MLKNIGNLFDNKKLAINRSQDQTDQIKEKLHLFLTNKFGESLKGLSLVINYNSRDKTLIINSDSKVIANELTLKLSELIGFLKENKINLSHILIK